jgi:hypothetical protein
MKIYFKGNRWRMQSATAFIRERGSRKQIRRRRKQLGAN